MNVRIGAPLNSELTPSLQWMEVHSTLQIPSFHVVGLPGPEISEARERVRAAILASGNKFPKRRIVINMSPSSVRKRGTGVDLAIALAILAASEKRGDRPGSDTGDALKIVAWGELGLDGSIKPAGQLARLVLAAWEAGAQAVIVPALEADECQHKFHLVRDGLAAGAGGIPGAPPKLIAAGNLREAWLAVKNIAFSGAAAAASCDARTPDGDTQKYASNPGSRVTALSLLPLSNAHERMFGAAVAGRHHILLIGPRGTGKTRATEWLEALQPEAQPDILLSRMIIAELLSPRLPSISRPVRRIGANVRPAALIGSASPVKIQPGEFTLAHGGMLIADEFPEWPRDSREVLREPLEQEQVTLTRSSSGTIEMPASFMFVATGNFCHCGGWPPEVPTPDCAENFSVCKCPPQARRQYMTRMSGPVLDRLDMVAKVTSASASGTQCGLTALRHRVDVCIARMKSCWGRECGKLDAAGVEQLLEKNPAWSAHPALARATSLRGRHKTLRLALTLAAWDGMDTPLPAHFSEAAMYRPEKTLFGCN